MEDDNLDDDDGPDKELKDEDEAEAAGGLGNLFGAALAAPKTALEEAREAAAKAKQAAEAKANKVALEKAAANEDLLDSLHRKMTTKEKKDLRIKRKGLGKQAEKLNTPKFVRAIGYVRCNCILGVPNDEPKEYIPVPDTRYCGEIEVRAEYRKEPQYKHKPPTDEVLQLVESFLDARTLGACAIVSTQWREMSEAMPQYFDLKHMEPYANFEAHDGKIEDMFVNRHRIYSAGTKMVRVWGIAKDYSGQQLFEEDTGMEKYNLLHTPVRDTAIIPKVMKANQSMYSAASNGAVREWVLAHNIHNIKFSGAMWEHSGWVNCVCPSAQTPGTCAMHGVVNHVCLLYTASDDRQVLVWDSVTRKRLGKIEPPNKQCGTMRSMALSDRHLFIGSSNGVIYIYPFEKTCERPDRHECSLATGPKRFCLQTQLRHGDKAITVLKIGGKHHVMEKLFSGSLDGTIAVFQLEPEGYEFECINVFDSHKSAITSISCSWSHMYSGSDDGTIRVWCLTTFAIQRVLHCGNRVKCLYIDEAHEDEEVVGAAAGAKKVVDGDDDAEIPTGFLYCGLSNGYVQKWRIGQWM
jgi:WD40 repeat protein